MSATSARTQAIIRAQTDTQAAYQVARRIESSWFRCQALAWIAWSADDKAFDSIIHEAVKAAFAAEDPYRCVGAAAWPVRAMIERGRSRQASATIAKVLPVAAQIPNPVCRGDALFLLWQAVFPLKPSAKIVLPALLSACHAMNSWKKPYLLHLVAFILASDNPAAAREVIATMDEDRLKRMVTRRIDAGESLTPRNFFWQNNNETKTNTP